MRSARPPHLTADGHFPAEDTRTEGFDRRIETNLAPFDPEADRTPDAGVVKALDRLRDTARAILDANGDYLLQIKENQKTILRNAENVAKVREPNGVKKK